MIEASAVYKDNKASGIRVAIERAHHWPAYMPAGGDITGLRTFTVNRYGEMELPRPRPRWERFIRWVLGKS